MKDAKQEIPATKAERDAWYGSAPDISDDIIAELTVQAKGYVYLMFSIKKAQKMAMNALADFGSDRVYVVPTTQEMIDAGDYGFRLKEVADDGNQAG